jgi:hypothetical protein
MGSRLNSERLEIHSLPALAHCFPRGFYVDHSHCLVLAPATLAALPSIRAIPDRGVFYVGNPFPRFVVNELRRASNEGTLRAFPYADPFTTFKV